MPRKRLIPFIMPLPIRMLPPLSEPDAAALLNHYLLYGKNEGRLPNASAEPGAEIEVFNEENLNQTKGFEPVPMAKLANLSSLRKKATDGELAQAYNAALAVVTPLAGLPREEQLIGIASRFAPWWTAEWFIPCQRPIIMIHMDILFYIRHPVQGVQGRQACA